MDDIDEVMERRFQEDGHWARPPRPVDTAVYEREIREGLGACLEETPPQQRMAFILRKIEELSSEEVCNILELTRTNLGVQLYRVRNRLRAISSARVGW